MDHLYVLSNTTGSSYCRRRHGQFSDWPPTSDTTCTYDWPTSGANHGQNHIGTQAAKYNHWYQVYLYPMWSHILAHHRRCHSHAHSVIACRISSSVVLAQIGHPLPVAELSTTRNGLENCTTHRRMLLDAVQTIKHDTATLVGWQRHRSTETAVKQSIWFEGPYPQHAAMQ